MIKLRLLWWENFLWLWEWAQFNFKDPYKREAKSQSQRRRYDERIRGWMMWGHEPRSTGHLQELETARKWILLQNHQKKYSPAITGILAQKDPCKFLTPRTVVHLHCFKPLHLWSFVVSTATGSQHTSFVHLYGLWDCTILVYWYQEHVSKGKMTCLKLKTF